MYSNRLRPVFQNALTFVSNVAFGSASTRLTILLQMCTGHNAEFVVACCVTVSWYMSFFCATNVMETESAVVNWVLSVITLWPCWKTMLRGVRTFVFLEPVVCEYSQDRQAKKKAPVHRSAICWKNTDLDRVYRCWSNAGVIAFWAFSFGSLFLKERMMPRMNLSVLPSLLCPFCCAFGVVHY